MESPETVFLWTMRCKNKYFLKNVYNIRTKISLMSTIFAHFFA